jgi:ankyrin repeat protein
LNFNLNENQSNECNNPNIEKIEELKREGLNLNVNSIQNNDSNILNIRVIHENYDTVGNKQDIIESEIDKEERKETKETKENDEGNEKDNIILYNSLLCINFSLKDGTRPIHSAAKYGHLNCLKLLVLYGADVNVTDCYGNTPLLLARLWGRNECDKYLSDYLNDNIVVV